jgi:hypothetical protein
MRNISPIATLPILALVAACSGGGSGAGSVTASESVSAGCAATASFALQPGETRMLSESEARCFALTKADGEYALAGYDPRAMDGARDRTGTGGFSEPQYTVADQSRGPAASRAARSASATDGELAPEGDLRRGVSSVVTEGEPYARATPWREGERFQVRPMVGTSTVSAKVVAVAGRFVLAVLESDADGAGGVLDQSEKALQFLASDGEAVLRDAFGGDVPVTSTGSGQLLVLAAAWPATNGAAATWTQEDASGTRSMVWLNTNLRAGKGDGYEMYDHVNYRVKVLAHELTHAWQVRWIRSAANGGHSAPVSASWSLEGGADLMGMDLLRRYMDVGVAANWHWTDYLDSRRPSVVYALEPADARGRLPWGYYDAASLLRDLQMRLVASGMSADAALAEVSRGSVEGWYGDDGEGGACNGLVERMRGRLGAAWDPAAAVLTWTLTQAADDRTSNPALNNPVYYSASGSDSYYGWKAAASVRAGSGEAENFTQVAGGSFFVSVRGPSAGGTLSATSTAPGSRWMIARIK